MDNKDIYDTTKIENIYDYVSFPAKKNIMLAVDHKPELLKQAKQLRFIQNTLIQDANKTIEFQNIDVVYSNILYWLNDPIKVLKELDLRLHKGSRIVLVFPNENFYKYCKSYIYKESKVWSLINRGRANNIMWKMNILEFESKVCKTTNLKIQRFQTYLSELNLKIWDIGFRPFSSPLIKMANSLMPKNRQEIKEEWVATARPYVDYIMEDELINGEKNGAFNFVVLGK